MMQNNIYHPMRLSKLLVLAIVAMLALASCSSNPEPLVIEESDGDTENQNPYSLTPTQFTSSKMKLGKLEMREFHEVVKANGIFDVPPQNHVSISAYFEGYVKQLQLLPGERVSKGQVLFVLENPGYVQVQQDFLEAQGQLTYLKSDYERQKSLAADNVTSQKNYLKAESDYTVTRVRYESLGKKLELMKINPDKLTIDNIRTTLTVTSPINGYVTEVNITPGSFLNPSDVAVSIVDTDHLHLELKIFEKDLSKIAVGQEIQFRIQNDRSGSYKATVHLVNKTRRVGRSVFMGIWWMRSSLSASIQACMSRRRFSPLLNPGHLCPKTRW